MKCHHRHKSNAGGSARRLETREKQKWAKEFVLIYSMDGGDGRPERVPDQFGIYDTKPGDEGYSPIWRYHFVTVPRDYEPNSIRSEEDIEKSGYRVDVADIYTN